MSENENACKKSLKRWPENCIWPEPIREGYGDDWDPDEVCLLDLDQETEELLEIKEYMDELVSCGRLLEDYRLNPDYEEPACEDDEDEEEEFFPEKGSDYWEDGFDYEAWEMDLIDHVNELKIRCCDAENDPVAVIREITGYSFINENLLRQAHTRSAFAAEYGLSGCSEELEFYGDMVLNTVVTRELFKRFTDPYIESTDTPYRSKYGEGDLSKLRASFVNKDYLSERSITLGLDKYILYGTDENPTNSAREDALEALIGAVAVDSAWNWKVLEDVVDRLLQLQLDDPDAILQISFYEQLNTWHQKHFGRIPKYEIMRDYRVAGSSASGRAGRESFSCVLTYSLPENDLGIRTEQVVRVSSEPTRSRARESAASQAVQFIMSRGLWLRLADSGIAPVLEEAVGQLQELHQKKYVEVPKYEYADVGDSWHCICVCGPFLGSGVGASKVKAKKQAAFAVLGKMFATPRTSGTSKEEIGHGSERV